MRVRMLTTAAGAEGVWPPGAVVTVAAELGAALVAGHYAERVEEAAAEVVTPASPGGRGRARRVIETPEGDREI